MVMVVGVGPGVDDGYFHNIHCCGIRHSIGTSETQIGGADKTEGFGKSCPCRSVKCDPEKGDPWHEPPGVSFESIRLPLGHNDTFYLTF